MDLGSLFVGLALVILVAAYIIKPILDRTGTTISETERRLSMLQAEQDRVLAAIEELEMDQTMGKVAQEDFHVQRQELLVRGADLLREQDELDPRGMDGEVADEGLASLESEFEAAVAKLRGSAEGPSVGFCGACGSTLISGDRFCASCGEPVEAVEDLA
jgi:hypothetical protein